MGWIFFFIVVLPVFDLALMGHLVGFWNTVFLVFGTACLGVLLIRHQGMAALRSGQAKMAAGIAPTRELATGLFLALAGLMFIHPGFITDLIGLLFLVPGLRHLLAGWALVRMRSVKMPGAERYRGEGVIDADFEEVVEENEEDVSTAGRNDGDQAPKRRITRQ